MYDPDLDSTPTEPKKLWTPPAAKLDKGLRLECMRIAAQLYGNENPPPMHIFEEYVQRLEKFVNAEDAKT